MLLPINYVNGIIVLPKSQIVTTRYVLAQNPIFADNYEVTFQCVVNENKDELQCLIEEIDGVLSIDLNHHSIQTKSNY